MAPPRRSRRPARAPATYHLGIRPGQLPRRVLLTGDPDRARRIAATWSRSAPLAQRREFTSFVGEHRGRALAVVSTGMGGPAMAIAVEELARLGATLFVRVGSSGSLTPRVHAGDLVITLASGRFDGTSRAYAPEGFPAVADVEAVGALVDAARARRVPHHVGLTASVDAFYLEEGRPGFGGYLPERWRGTRDSLRRLGFLNVEMETGTLLTVARIYGLRAAAVCAVFGAGPQRRPVPMGEEAAIGVASDALASVR